MSGDPLLTDPYPADSVGTDDVSELTVAVSSPEFRRTGRARTVLFWMAVGWVALIIFGAVFANVLPLPKQAQRVGLPRISPFAHWAHGEVLGTDTFGRSNLARAVYGARNSLLIGVTAAFIGVFIGGFVGLASGYLRGWTDRLSSFVVDTLLAFPALILLLTISAVLGPKPSTVLIALALLVVPSFVRIERAAALSWSERPFVLAARSYGSGELRIAIRHVLPNSALTLISVMPTLISGLIVAEGALSYLGLGIPSPNASWGVMISEGQSVLETSPAVVFVPAAFVFLTVLSFNIIGEHTRARLESRGRA
jgi:peptide/nickel transport system permease protein